MKCQGSAALLGGGACTGAGGCGGRGARAVREVGAPGRPMEDREDGPEDGVVPTSSIKRLYF